MLLVFAVALVAAAPDVNLETLIDATAAFPVAESLCTIAEERRLATLAQILVTQAAHGALDIMIDDLTNSEAQFLAKRGFLVSGTGARDGQTVHSLCGNAEQRDVTQLVFIIDWSAPCNDDDYEDDDRTIKINWIDTVK